MPKFNFGGIEFPQATSLEQMDLYQGTALAVPNRFAPVGFSPWKGRAHASDSFKMPGLAGG
jgi:hypothetical protein